MDKNKYNELKQKLAFLPNFVHSLDGATMALLFKLFNKITDGGNISGIHDCFLVTADNVENLLDSLRAVYMKIYVYDEYITEFDALFIHYIEYLSKENEYLFDKENRVLITRGKKYFIPKPLEVDRNNFPDLQTSTPAM